MHTHSKSKEHITARARVSKRKKILVEIEEVWEGHLRGWNSRRAKENRHNFRARGLRTAEGHLENNKYYYQGLKKTVHLGKYQREN